MDEAFTGNENGIITLQCGHYSNFVGAHWWNIQKSSKEQSERLNISRSSRPTPSGSHKQLFREGVNGEAYTPRLVCIDLKGSLKNLNEDGSLHANDQKVNLARRHVEDERSRIPSPHDISVHQTDNYVKNSYLADVADHDTESCSHGTVKSPENLNSQKFYNLDDVVDVWSDYLGTTYHRNSVLLLNDYAYSENSNNFKSFGLGYSMNKDEKFWDSLEDKLHFFAEECDTLQGFQVLVDLDDGFGGLGTRILQNLRDIYGPKATGVFGNCSGSSLSLIDEEQHLMNSALAVGHLADESTLFAPLSLEKKYCGKEKSKRSFPFLNINPNLHYHSSALVASFLDSITQQYRNGSSSLGEFCNSITKTGHKIASSGFSIPLATHTKSIAATLKGVTGLYDSTLLQCLTPSQCFSRTVFSQQIVLRGFPTVYESKVFSSSRQPKVTSNIEEFERFVYNTYSTGSTGLTFCEQPLFTAPPYPQYFDSRVKKNGFLQEFETSKPLKGNCVNCVPTLSSLYTSDGLFDTLYDLIVSVKKLHKSKIVMLEQSGIEPDELSESIERLGNFAQQYDEKRAYSLL